MFHDEVQVILKSGKGGDGAVSFRREKYIPKGGPDGGDGGKGGDVYIMATSHINDLNQYASVRELKAEDGVQGTSRKMIGRYGEDLVVSVPIGTRIYRQKPDGTWRFLYDLTEHEKQIKLLSGGQGGFGNVHFATATHQTPRYAQPGQPAQKGVYKFELQLIADMGIIGKPNAGKSTFLSIVSDAKPKIANYPFTTLSPILGVVNHYDRRLVFADIPGLIEGASQGKGLGLQFLRHVKRTKGLVHFIDVLSEDYARDYETIRQELGKYDESLLVKPELVVITKAELLPEGVDNEKVSALKRVIHSPSELFTKITISSVTKTHIPELLNAVFSLIDLDTDKQLDKSDEQE